MEMDEYSVREIIEVLFLFLLLGALGVMIIINLIRLAFSVTEVSKNIMDVKIHESETELKEEHTR
jgi:hypothetical protein